MYIRYLSIFVFVASINLAWASVTTEYSWDQLDETFQQTIKIPLDGRAILKVNIPAQQLENKKKLTFKMALDTPFRTQSDDAYDTTSGFSGFSPFVAVNGRKFTGVYSIRFKYADGINQANAYVKIKSKHLHPGLNSLAFDANKRIDYIFSCSGSRSNCTAIYVHKIWLEQ